MADLTATEITHIRNVIGDTDTSDPDLSDTYLEYLFDNDGASDVDQTIVYAIAALMGKASRLVSTSQANTGDSKSAQQWFEHLKDLLKMWENKTGVYLSRGGLVTTGTINLGIDEEDDQFDIT